MRTIFTEITCVTNSWLLTGESGAHPVPVPNFAEMPTPLRIFVVEDHPDTLEYMQMYLETLGHTVLTADTMTKALATLPRADCDVLISDIGLPDGDGWLLMRRLQLPQPIYAIAMSGFGMGEDQLKSQEAGFRHHLLKPIRPKELDTALENAARELSGAR